MVEEQGGNKEQGGNQEQGTGGGRDQGSEEGVEHRRAMVTPRGKGRGPEAAMEVVAKAEVDEALREGDESNSKNECSFGLM